MCSAERKQGRIHPENIFIEPQIPDSLKEYGRESYA